MIRASLILFILSLQPATSQPALNFDTAPMVATASAVAPQTNPPSLVFITRSPLTPDFRIWHSEKPTTNLSEWKVWSEWTSPSNRPTAQVPKLRDNARLLDWFIVRPTITRFFRLEVLP